MARGIIAAVAAAAALAAAGCGGDDDGQDGAREGEQPGLGAIATGENIGTPYMAASDPDAEIDVPQGAAEPAPGDAVAGAPRAGDILEGIEQPTEAVRRRRTARCTGVTADASSTSPRRLESAVVCLINAERASRRLRPLRVNSRLRRAARGHAQDMVSNQFLSHDSQDGRDLLDRLRAARYLRRGSRFSTGENIGFAPTPREMVRGWMRSRPHRANILSRSYREVGIGAEQGFPVSSPGDGGTFTANFGAIRR